MARTLTLFTPSTDQIAVEIEHADTSRSFGHIDHIFVDVHVVGRQDICPLFQVVSIVIEQLDAVVFAVADVDAERLQQFGEQWGIAPEHRYSTAAQMFAEASLDVVSVTTPPIHHHHPVIEAAEGGVKVILVEKPLAMSVEWGRKMVEACDRAG